MLAHLTKFCYIKTLEVVLSPGCGLRALLHCPDLHQAFPHVQGSFDCRSSVHIFVLFQMSFCRLCLLSSGGSEWQDWLEAGSL